VFRSEKVSEILKGNFHIAEEKELSEEEKDFLSFFFNISLEEDINPEDMKIKRFLILEKKDKFTYH